MLQNNHDLNVRLEFVLRHFGLNQKELAEKAEISPSTISTAINQNKIGAQIIYTVLNLYPQLSAEWFLRGEGPMLRTQQRIDIPTNMDPLVFKLQELSSLIRIVGRELDNFSEVIRQQESSPEK